MSFVIESCLNSSMIVKEYTYVIVIGLDGPCRSGVEKNYVFFLKKTKQYNRLVYDE